MLEIISVMFLLIVLITAGAVLMSNDSSQLIGRGFILYMMGLIIWGLSVTSFNNTEKTLALELYHQGKPVTTYQSRFILSSDEYTPDNPIVLKKKDTQND